MPSWPIEPQLFAEVRAPAALKGVDMHMTG
jgi:hypothetical protein